jgi:hypothetical protein
MNSRMLSYISIGVFLVLGTVCLLTRYESRKSAQLAQDESLWNLTYKIDFEADDAGSEVRVALPFDTRHCEVIDRELIHTGLQGDVRGPFRLTGNNELQVVAPRAGSFEVAAKFQLRLSPEEDPSREPPMEYMPPSEQRFVREEQDIPVGSETVQKFIQRMPIELRTTSEKLQWIFREVKSIPSDSVGATDQATAALDEAVRSGTPLARMRAMVALCRALRIPARLVVGFEIKEQADAKPIVWVEVFQNQKWIPFDPVNGHARSLPQNVVPVRRGGKDGGGRIVEFTNATNLVEHYSIERLDPPEKVLQAELAHPMQILDLTRLPLPMQPVMAILLLLPLAALITTVVRNVVGIQTFGTFSPALLAMSFIYANWETGLAILIVVMTAGILSRTWLEKLRLLAVPRLSIILTVVILCVVFGVSLLDYMNLTPSAQAVLLPMVILTMLIERFYVTTEEDGLMFTIKLAAGTLMVAALCYVMLSWDEVGNFVLVYPEAHFFTIAVFILIGRYAGYRITELWRFRDLVELNENP